VNALNVFPPEKHGNGGTECRREGIVGEVIQGMVEVYRNVVQKADKVLAGNHRAQRARKYIVEQQCRYRKLGQRPTHGAPHHAIHAAAHEHAGGLDIQHANAVREQHDRENEPGRALANDLLGVAAHVISRRAKVR